MDSHEEKLHQMIRASKESEAIDQMKRKAVEIREQQRDVVASSRMQGVGGVGGGIGAGPGAGMGEGSGAAGIGGGLGGGAGDSSFSAPSMPSAAVRAPQRTTLAFPYTLTQSRPANVLRPPSVDCRRRLGPWLAAPLPTVPFTARATPPAPG